MSTTPAPLISTTSTTDPTVVVDGSAATTAGAAAHAHPIRRATLVSGAIAAVGVTALAAGADAAGVPFAVDGETIPLAGFTQMTVVGAALGGLLAAGLQRWTARPRSLFFVVTAVLTVLSCIPSATMPPDTASRLVLVATHLVAAAVVVPALARQLRR